MYTPRPEDIARVERNFRSGPALTDGQAGRCEIARNLGLGVSNRLLTLCPPGRELHLALTKIEEGILWACAAVAREGLAGGG